jgi:hypothetical protein
MELSKFDIPTVAKALDFSSDTGDARFDLELTHVMMPRVCTLDSCREREEKALKLLEKHDSPEAKGAVYFQIVDYYGQSGMLDPDRICKYIELASKYPLAPGVLDVVPRTFLYSYWGGAIKRVLRNKGEPPEQWRKAACQKYLEGLKLILVYDVPEQELPLPGISLVPPMSKVSGPGVRPLRGLDENAIWKKNREEVIARNKAKFINRLVMLKKGHEDCIVNLYAMPVPAPDVLELRRLAEEVLGAERKEYIDKLVVKVEAAAKQKAQKALERRGGRTNRGR